MSTEDREHGTDGTETGDAPAPAPPLFVVDGEASDEELAALTVVLHGLAVAGTAADEPQVRSEWAAHHRKVRASYPHGPGGWRSSALPR